MPAEAFRSAWRRPVGKLLEIDRKSEGLKDRLSRTGFQRVRQMLWVLVVWGAISDASALNAQVRPSLREVKFHQLALARDSHSDDTWSMVLNLKAGQALRVATNDRTLTRVWFSSASDTHMVVSSSLDSKSLQTPVVIRREDVLKVEAYHRISPGAGLGLAVLGGLVAIELPLTTVGDHTPKGFVFGMAGLGAAGFALGVHMVREHPVVIYQRR